MVQVTVKVSVFKPLLITVALGVTKVFSLTTCPGKSQLTGATS